VDVLIVAGQGIAAAHGAGLVHRDIKPENILVGADGRVRVTDFGLARSGPAPAAPARLVIADDNLTTTGVLLGTPAYMAPEVLRGGHADARSDQFSFCASLYEGLHGKRPFTGRTVDELMQAMDRDGVDWPDDSPAPAWLRRALLRGLDCDPERRWPSMAALLATLERGRQQIWRRILAGAAIGTAVALVAGVLGYRAHGPEVCPTAAPLLSGVWDSSRRTAVTRAFTSSGQSYAPAALEEVVRTLDGYASSWIAMRDDACRATRVLGTQSAELMDLRMDCLAGALNELDALVGVYERADAEVVARAAAGAHELPRLALCADGPALLARQRLPAAPAARAHIVALRRSIAEARALGDAGKLQDAATRAMSICDEAAGVGWRPLEAEALLVAGRALEATWDIKRAVPFLRRARNAAEAGHANRIKAEAGILLVEALGTGLGRLAEAEELADETAAVIEGMGGDPRLDAELRTQRGALLLARDDVPRAITELRAALAAAERALGTDAIGTTQSMTTLAVALVRGGQLDEALGLYQRALAIDTRWEGPEHPDLAGNLDNMAQVYAALGRRDEALATQRRSVALVERTEPDSGQLARTLSSLGTVLAAVGQPDAAIAPFGRARALMARLAPRTPDLAQLDGEAARTQRVLGHFKEALALDREALAIFEELQPAGSTERVLGAYAIGLDQLGLGRAAEALPALDAAVRALEQRPAMASTLAEAKTAAEKARRAAR
jgi:tetratricopeptide (TPR) repeat protein